MTKTIQDRELTNNRITYAATTEGIERAEKSLRRLGFKSKKNFAESILISRATVTKFFDRQPIEQDCFETICNELQLLDWKEIAWIKSSDDNEKDALINTSDNDEERKNEEKSRLIENVRNRDFSSLQLYGGDLRNADLRNADLSYTNLFDVHLSHADLSHANLSHANLSDTDLSGANLCGANLCGANLYDTNLSDTNLSDTNLSGANLSGANLSGANLYDARLSGVNLSRANLSGANLNDVNLSRANLSDANLCGTNLILANLSGAKVANARFEDNRGISESLKLDLKARGAIFEDSLGDRSEVLTRT